MDCKTKTFQYKFLHDILVNSYWLKKWAIKNSEMCIYCHNDTEHIEHLFWESPLIQQLVIVNFIRFCDEQCDYELTKTDFFLGVDNRLVNDMIVVCKLCIYNSRLNEARPHFYGFINDLKRRKGLEFEMAKTNGKMNMYLEKWGELGI